ncbi:MAG: hypothetical protein PSX81_07450 [bacterium]|nr:hypothetical protein [bacterium]
MEKNTNTDNTLLVRRGRVDSVNLYEVKENELEILENGEETVIQLNFAIFLLSIAFSGILTLCSATFKSKLLENTFLFSTIIGAILGVYLLLMWWIGRKSIKKIIKTIKNRIEIDEEKETIELPNIESIEKNNDLIKPVG